MLIIRPSLGPNVYLACKINNASGDSAESKKVRDSSKGGVGVPRKTSIYDVSRGQNRYVTLPLAI